MKGERQHLAKDVCCIFGSQDECGLQLFSLYRDLPNEVCGIGGIHAAKLGDCLTRVMCISNSDQPTVQSYAGEDDWAT